MVSALMLVTALSFSPPQTRAAGAAVRGVVVDARTTAPILDARVLLVELGRSLQTSSEGRFEFANVAPGRYTLTISRIGYIFIHRQVNVGSAGIELTLPLSEGTGTYQENVTITATTGSPSEVGVASQTELGSAGLQDLRGVAADDPMRAMQALPGVATGDDFQAQFSVRGSAFRHVGIVIDGTATPLLLHTVRNTNDTGSVAMINTDVLDRASLMAGPHPQRHGDWLGATLEFGLREGSRDRAQLRAAVSGTSASVVLEGPIGRSKRASWLTSIRRSYVDWLIRKIDPSIDATLGFSDAQAKVAYDLTNRQQIQFVLVGGDATYRDDDTGQANGLHTANSKSALGSLAWRYARNALLVTQRVSFIGSKFKDLGILGQELGSGYARGLVWRGDAMWLLNKQWSVDFGGKSEWQHQTLMERNFLIVNGRPQPRFTAGASNDTDLVSGWAEVSRHTSTTAVSAGVRPTRDSLARRVVPSRWLLGEWTRGAITFRGGAAMSHQFPELELQRGLPERVPEHSGQLEASIEHRLTRSLRWQMTGFTRNDRDVIRRAGEDHLEAGKRIPETTFPRFASTLGGRARGLDFTFQRRGTAGLTGWIAYTYAHTRYHDRATKENFDGDFDQRHTVNVFVQERLSYRTAVSAKLRFGSNFPLVGYFQGTVDALRLAPDRNRIRLPTYARLDLRANRTFTFDRRRLTLFIEVMNATGHRNIGQGSGVIRGTAFDAIGYTEKLIPFVPSLGMLIEF